VDDSPEGNAGVVQQLRNLGVGVTTALNTAEALRRYDPSVHQLVISDMGRFEGPNDAYVGRAGFNLLEGLRTRRPDVQVVFCTSERAVSNFRAEALAAGALDMVADCRDIVRFIGF
jgi:CheY-like chemotaxis protein